MGPDRSLVLVLADNVRAMAAPLLELASTHLAPDGRLVFLFPTFCTQVEEGLWDPDVAGGAVIWDEELRRHLPTHPSLRLVSVTHEPCPSRTMARNIVCMRRK